MPFRVRPQPKQPVWKVNTEQEPLDAMYDSFVGRAGEALKGDAKRGREMLTEEVKVRFYHRLNLEEYYLLAP